RHLVPAALAHAGQLAGVGHQVVRLGVLAGGKGRGGHPILHQLLVVAAGVDEQAAVDVHLAAGACRNVELGVADGDAGRAEAAPVVPFLAVVDLPDARHLGVDGVPSPEAAVGEDGVGLGVGPGLGSGGGIDVDAVEAEDLGERS